MRDVRKLGEVNYISMCSGIEAASAAYIPLGWIPVAFSEIEKFRCKVLAHHHPNVPNHGDFTAFDWSTYRGAIDALVAGTPCQSFSVAGLRNSLADARGNLTLEFIRAANAIQPRYIIWENVPGVLSTSDNAFGCFLAGLVGCNEPIVAEQGWPNAGVVHGPERAACWRILDAQYFGLAQRRKRVFVVASPRGGPNPAEVLFEWESLRRDNPPSREAGQDAAAYSPSSIGGYSEASGACAPTAATSGGRAVNHSLPALSMCLNGGGMGRIDAESETLIAIGVDEEQNAASELMGCLMSRQSGGGHEAFVAHALTKSYNSINDGCGRGVPLVPICMTSEQSPAVDLCPTPKKEPGGLGYHFNSGLAVRRLTPLECERLQGFPDNYTAIPGAADGPRYKALGNSMAVPVMRWIGERISRLS